MKRHYRLREDIRFRVVGDEAVVLQLAGSQVMGLNPTGTRILELVEAGQKPEDIVETLTLETEGDPETVRKDVEAFLAELVEQAVLEATESVEPAVLETEV
ncbi:MAG: PqqD family protein [Thermoanaerobaculia bacterium]|nr:PqqD family protein [Thermoanaerobaculia bacterium]